MNIVGQAGLRDKQVRRLIYSMIGIAFVIGLILTYQTGWLMLVMGALRVLLEYFTRLVLFHYRVCHLGKFLVG